MTRISESADVAPSAMVGEQSSIWHLAQVREGASVGNGCTVGRGAYIGVGVRIGDHCKIQNYALIYEPAELENGVFVGPAAVLTNDQYPRAVSGNGLPKTIEDWTPVGVLCREGASIGARAVCVAPVTIGRWAMVAAGAVVVSDVPDFALVVGTPARHVRWVGREGAPLQPGAQTGLWVCPRSSDLYLEQDGQLMEMSR